MSVKKQLVMSNATAMGHRLTKGRENANRVTQSVILNPVLNIVSALFQDLKRSRIRRSRNNAETIFSTGFGMTGKPDLGNTGFTLLEVMVALVIIATSFVTLLHTRNQSVTAADYAIRATVATLLASERMSDIENGDFPETGEDSSNFGDDYPEYRWKTSVSDTAYDNIREVKVDVMWGREGSERSVGLVNFVRKKEQP